MTLGELRAFLNNYADLDDHHIAVDHLPANIDQRNLIISGECYGNIAILTHDNNWETKK
jgi:hypothetical protein